ncbi:MAG TPA: hypothetical protein DDY90_06320 [Clostridiales bacterium]|nr:hypothetical protein [Clostridiales bacterium]
MGQIRAEEQAAAIAQRVELWVVENRAVIVMFLLKNFNILYPAERHLSTRKRLQNLLRFFAFFVYNAQGRLR